jgi:hypothetical protein
MRVERPPQVSRQVVMPTAAQIDSGGEDLMHALLVTLDIDPSRADEAMNLLKTFAVPMISSGEGFVSGTWFRSADGARGHSLILFNDEASARAGAERAAEGPPPGAPTSFVSAEVFEVVAQA